MPCLVANWGVRNMYIKFDCSDLEKDAEFQRLVVQFSKAKMELLNYLNKATEIQIAPVCKEKSEE